MDTDRRLPTQAERVTGVGVFGQQLLLFTVLAASAPPHRPRVAQYQNIVLNARELGAKQLEIEMQRDPAIRDYVARNGNPDFIYVPSATVVELIYYQSSKLILFYRDRSGADSVTGELSPLPLEVTNVLPVDIRAGTPGPIARDTLRVAGRCPRPRTAATPAAKVPSSARRAARKSPPSPPGGHSPPAQGDRNERTDSNPASHDRPGSHDHRCGRAGPALGPLRAAAHPQAQGRGRADARGGPPHGRLRRRLARLPRRRRAGSEVARRGRRSHPRRRRPARQGRARGGRAVPAEPPRRRPRGR